MALLLEPSMPTSVVVRAVGHALDGAAGLLREANSPALPAGVQDALCRVVAAMMNCTAGAVRSGGGAVEGLNLASFMVELLLHGLKQDEQVEVLSCSQLWWQLVACLTEAAGDAEHVEMVCNVFAALCEFGKPTSCLVPAMFAAHPMYVAGLLRVLVKERLLCLRIAGSSSGSGQQHAACAVAPVFAPSVAEEMRVCIQVLESLLGSDGRPGRVQRLAAAYAEAAASNCTSEQAAQAAHVDHMFTCLQLVESAMGLLMQPEAVVFAHIEVETASGKPTAALLADAVCGHLLLAEERLRAVA